MYEIEGGAFKIFIRQIFDLTKEIEDVGALNIIKQLESGSIVKLMLNKFCSPKLSMMWCIIK